MKPAVRVKRRSSRSIGKVARASRRRKHASYQVVSERMTGRKSRRMVTYGRKFRSTYRQAPHLPVGSRGLRILSIARNAGRRYGIDHPVPAGSQPKMWLQQLWAGFWQSPEAVPIPRSAYREAAKAFQQGYRSNYPFEVDPVVLLPTHRKVGTVVTAMNEERMLPGVLEQLNLLPLDETIIIVNGSNDRTLDYARMNEDAIVLHYANPLGHDVGRAIGAKLSNADIVLFLEGDFVVEADQLAHLVYTVENGVDVALNDISPFSGVFRGRDNVTIIKEFLNRALGRPDLQASSLTAVPHALSRHAIHTIGYRELMVPPKAHALAIASGLRVEAPVSVDVLSRKKMRMTNVGQLNPVERLIMGDHFEALQAAMAMNGSRLGFPDATRRRV